MKKIILASSSPRRIEILKMLFDDFLVDPSDAEELTQGDPLEVAVLNAQKKAEDVSKRHKDGIVIAADTIVVLDDKILGKPKNKKNAISMLKKISGKEVITVSGICVIDAALGISLTSHEITNLKFRKLTDEEILAYVETGEPLDKSGSFAVNGKGALFVEKMDGCFWGCVGLPVFRLGRMLEKVGVKIL